MSDGERTDDGSGDGGTVPYAERDDLTPKNDSAPEEDDGASRLGRRIVGGLLGVDIVARLGPELADTVLPYLFGVTRLLDPGVGESVIILFGLVIRYPAAVWVLSWLALVALTMLYVPEFVRPELPDWPGSFIQRALFAVPAVWAGLVVEAGFRRVLSVTVGPTTAPFVAPLTPLTVGGGLAATLVLFGSVYRGSDPQGSVREHSLAGYLSRGLVLTTILGMFLAAFSMLSPYAEVLTVALLVASQREGATEPAERLVESVGAVWERPAQTVLAVYVASALTVVVLVLLAVRVRAPPAMLFQAPLSTLYLLIVATAALAYTLGYCERALRPFRRNYDPETEPTALVQGAMIPAAVLVSLLLDNYVFGDPLAGPGLVAGVGGVVVAATALTQMRSSELDFFSTVTEGPVENETSTGELEVIKQATLLPDHDVTRVTFEIESGYDSPTELKLQETLAYWARPAFVLEMDGSGEWDADDGKLVYQTTLQGGETETVRYWLATPETAVADEAMRGFKLRFDTEETTNNTTTVNGEYEYNLPPFHLPPVAVALFAALLCAVDPLEGQFLATAVFDGSILGLDLLGTAQRFTTVFLVVALPYVPVGVLSHQRHIDELVSSLKFDIDPDGRNSATAKHYLKTATVALTAIGLGVVGIPVLPSLLETVLFGGLALYVGVLLLLPPDDEGSFWWSAFFVIKYVGFGLMWTLLYPLVALLILIMLMLAALGLFDE